MSQPLAQVDAGWYRSVVGSCLYLGRDRPDFVFTIEEVASRMAKPTLNALQQLRKMVGYLRTTGELGISLHVPAAGQGKWKSCVDKFWILETHSDADWASDNGHRKSTSCSIHFLNGSYVFGAARTQRVIALSSCESELHSIVSGMCDAIYIRRVLGVHTECADSPSAVHRQFKCAPTGIEAGLWKDKTSFWKNTLGSEQNQGQGGGTCSGANKPERQ